ncbi:MAG: transcription elongation factor GreA [Parcubacteria group bacterium GW2011_GWF2_38_76]|nr:MAG: transcription elongation factor GreA [Parcubacteria group bacterium GW2011_GWF2_38_76]HBM46085.1 transcription elongation factor GreA [Patescibacteria group bacterium]
MTTNVQYLSQEKLNELRAELDDLKTRKRKEITESLEFAKSLGDLSENAEYQEAREMQAGVEQRITDLEAILKDAVVVSADHKGIIGMGSIVVVKTEPGKETKEFQVVGSEEANVIMGKISNLSPIGMALVGKKVGMTITVNTPKGAIQYKIIEIK